MATTATAPAAMPAAAPAERPPPFWVPPSLGGEVGEGPSVPLGVAVMLSELLSSVVGFVVGEVWVRLRVVVRRVVVSSSSSLSFVVEERDFVVVRVVRAFSAWSRASSVKALLLRGARPGWDGC
jgi:hypothetical protein